MSLLVPETGFRLQAASAVRQTVPDIRQVAPDASCGPIVSTTSMGVVVRDIALRTARLLGDRLHHRICVLAALGPNWDGDRGEPVKSHVLAEAVETLRRLKWQFGRNFAEPSLVPTFDGFLQVEWHEKNRSLDLEAVNKGWSAVGTSKTPLGKNEYSEGEFERSDFDKIVRLYLWVTGSELLWPLT